MDEFTFWPLRPGLFLFLVVLRWKRGLKQFLFLTVYHPQQNNIMIIKNKKILNFFLAVQCNDVYRALFYQNGTNIFFVQYLIQVKIATLLQLFNIFIYIHHNRRKEIIFFVQNPLSDPFFDNNRVIVFNNMVLIF